MIRRDYTIPPQEDTKSGTREDTPPSQPGQVVVMEEPIKDEEVTTEQLKRFADPRVFGPGLWLAIHITGFQTDSPEKIEAFIIWLWQILNNIPCGVCRDHALQYIEDNPPEARLNEVTYELGSIPRYIGMFHWTWIFHNSVNARIGKTPLSWEAALKRYSELAKSPLCKGESNEEQKSGCGS